MRKILGRDGLVHLTDDYVIISASLFMCCRGPATDAEYHHGTVKGGERAMMKTVSEAVIAAKERQVDCLVCFMLVEQP
jgi:hypothetical protein